MTPAELTARGVRVKPLVWRTVSDKFGEMIDAFAPNVGEYSLRGHDRGYTIIWLNEQPFHPVRHGAHFTYGDVETAKAVAQADYEARICAALTTGENDD